MHSVTRGPYVANKSACIDVLLYRYRITTEANTPLSDDGFSQKCPSIFNQNVNGVTSSSLLGKGFFQQTITSPLAGL